MHKLLSNFFIEINNYFQTSEKSLVTPLQYINVKFTYYDYKTLLYLS